LRLFSLSEALDDPFHIVGQCLQSAFENFLELHAFPRLRPLQAV
jgi:hypothetical protein